jgi:hypothetical protein
MRGGRVHYKQLKNYFRQRDQKAFWIFSYANIAGLFAGLFVGRFLGNLLPWIPGVLLIPSAMLAGLSLTWQRQGRETYRAWWLRCRYASRQLFRSPSLILDSTQYYQAYQPRIRPFSVAGRIEYSGDGLRHKSGESAAGALAPHEDTQSLAMETLPETRIEEGALNGD